MNAKFRSPLHQDKGWGSAKSGTGHFWWQRVTAVILALLVPYIVFLLAHIGGSDADSLRATIAKPWNAIIFTVFAIALFWHAKLGLQVVIEDYVRPESTRKAVDLLQKAVCLILALFAALAVLRIAV